MSHGRPDQLPARTQRTTDVELADLQGNVLRGYPHQVGDYAFLRVEDVSAARSWLAGRTAHVTTAEPWDDVPSSTFNLSFSGAGLTALGVPATVLASFPEEFRTGMAGRAALLGDVGESAPETWEPGLGSTDTHVLAVLCGTDESALDTARRRLQTSLEESPGAFSVVHDQRSQMLPFGRDHFGFQDGIAQPAIEGSGTTPRPGDGLPGEDGTWRSVALGEFVLGFPDQDGVLPSAPAAPFDRLATFVVYRKLQMHPARLWSHLASVPGREPSWLAAKMVGRWQDGTPLVVSPDGPDARVAGDPARVNNFRYTEDPDGLACPAGAHVRRTNPRDQDGFFGGKLSDRHRIIRRGRSYGPPSEVGSTEDDGADRGLLFECYQADLERQFEVIQSRWVDDGDPFGLGEASDPLIGPREDGDRGSRSRLVVPGSPPQVLARLPRFVTLRGGAYLVRPSLTAIRWLASDR